LRGPRVTWVKEDLGGIRWPGGKGVSAYIVEYGLRNPEQNHPRLSKAIKKKYHYWHILEFTWIIDACESASQIYDYLEANIGENDKLFVCQLAGDAALADNFSDKGMDWLERIL
jgi:hypothetical protein